MTRRTLLLAGAGALAGAAVRPVGAWAAGAQPSEPLLSEIALGTVRAPGATVALAGGVALVGLQWQRPPDAHPQLRVRLADGRWGPWVSAAAHGHGPEADAGEAATRGEPLWIGGARELQLRSAKPLMGARLHLVSSGSGESAQASAPALAQPVLQAGAGQPPIIAREAWARGTAPPRFAPEYGAVELGFVHHTENPNGYSAAQVPAMLRAIYAFHRFVNGWNDIGYNFVVDLYGRVFEARAGGIDEPVVGAHAGGYNLVSSGVAVLGSFSGTPISPQARAALTRLLAWKLSLHGLPAMGRVTVRVNPAGASYSKYPARARVSLPRIAGHRDADSTECPGDVLYGELPSIRGTVTRLAGTPVLATLAQAPGAPAPPVTAPAEGQPRTPTLLASLALPDGTPLAGVPLLLQARSVARRGQAVLESTVAEGTTDAQGSARCRAPSPPAPRGRCGSGRSTRAERATARPVSRAIEVAPLPALSPPASAPSG